MDPKIWGPFTWKFIHTSACAFPDEPTQEQQQSAIALFRSLQDMLPCASCQNHWRQNLAKNPVENHVHNGESLFRWTFNIHNAVNQSLGKKIQVDFGQTYAKYKSMRVWISQAEKKLSRAPDEHLDYLETVLARERERREHAPKDNNNPQNSVLQKRLLPDHMPKARRDTMCANHGGPK
jgi:hypothetical protein